jgi:hypothetical protein
VAPLEPWEKVLVSQDFMKTVHGSGTCISCHGGQQDPNKETAHAGLVADPSIDSKACASCHKDISETAATSLHTTLAGYWTSLDARSLPEDHPKIEEAFNNHCSSCHSTCGDCHISQPNSVGGGLLNAHVVEKTPPMTRTCTACHGSRIGADYLGKHEDIPGDVHFREGRMTCVTCHKGTEMHASAGEGNVTRYAAADAPACLDCHPKVGAADDTIQQHVLHKDKLSCQVCHSVEYTSCDGCHVSISETTGNPMYKTEGDSLTFFIGLNPLQSDTRPYKYVTVRHIPIAQDNFDFYGDDLLKNFDSLPTWKYTTPHNIQRITPQNSACTNCHGNADIFLTADKVKPEELEANQPVIVPAVPAPVGQ